MKIFQGRLMLLLLALSGCSAAEGGGDSAPTAEEGEAPDVAGGQSGTDSSGAYDCSLEVDEPLGEEVPLAEKPEAISCSPNEAFALLEGERTYRCRKLGLSFDVAIGRGEVARRVVGTLQPEGDEPERQCFALQLDTEIQIRASDDSLSFDSSLVTSDHLCSQFRVAGSGARDVGGATSQLTFMLESSADEREPYFMHVWVDGRAPDSCELDSSVPGAGGSGG